MAELPIISGNEAKRAFENLGYREVRQKGSHVRMKCEGRQPITVPLKNTLKKETLNSLIKAAGLTSDEFVELL